MSQPPRRARKSRALDPATAARRFVADRIRDVMKAEDVSMSTLAREAGLSPSQVSYFLAGRRDINFGAAIRLFNRLGLEVGIKPPEHAPAG